jgi:hypothetical protein
MVGGILTEPAESYPDTFSRDGLFARYPFLLPNLVCAGFLGFSVLFAYFFLIETHPDMQPWSVREDLDNTSAATPLFPAAGAVNNAAAVLSTESYGTFDSVTITEDAYHESKPANLRRSTVFTKNIIMLTIALAIFTYHSMTFDTLMPIFFQDARQEPASKLSGGLGLSTQDVGIIMSLNGVIALFVQGIVFPYMASWLGIWRLTVLVTVGHPLAYFVMPFLIEVPQNWVHGGIYAALSLRNFFAILVYPLLLILIKEAAPNAHLGKINGLAASAGSLARMLASPVAGLLYGVGSRLHFTPVAWWASGLVAAVGAIQILFVGRMKNKTAHVRTVAAWTEEGGRDWRSDNAQDRSKYHDDSGTSHAP